MNMHYEESQPEINPFDIFTQTAQSGINARREIGNVIPSGKKQYSSAKKSNKARGQQVYGTPVPTNTNKDRSILLQPEQVNFFSSMKGNIGIGIITKSKGAIGIKNQAKKQYAS